MRKNEIKTGVVYAYQERASGTPQPVVFLAPPARSRIYRLSPQRGEEGAPYFAAVAPGKKAGRLTGGYPVVFAADAATAPDALRNTLADFEAVTTGRAQGGRFSFVANLTYIVGPYEQVLAERAERFRREREAARAGMAERAALRDRPASLADRFAALGFAVTRPGLSFIDADSGLEMAPDVAEAILARLED